MLAELEPSYLGRADEAHAPPRKEEFLQRQRTDLSVAPLHSQRVTQADHEAGHLAIALLDEWNPQLRCFPFSMGETVASRL